MYATIRTLSSLERGQIAQHLQQLSPDDRRSRFGAALNDAAIAHYVDAIDFARDKVLGVVEENDELVALAHVGFEPLRDTAELGLSVAAGSRCLGYGYALLCAAALHSRRAGRGRLSMHCLAENRVMLHLARKAGMSVLSERGEAGAYMAIGGAPEQPADAPRPVAGRRARAILLGVLLPAFALDMALMVAAGAACDSCRPQPTLKVSQCAAPSRTDCSPQR